MAVVLLGKEAEYIGKASSGIYGWFTDSGIRDLYVDEDHGTHGRNRVTALRRATTKAGPASAAAMLARELNRVSEESAHYWSAHEVGLTYNAEKRFAHPEVGRMDLFCQTLEDPAQHYSLLVFTAQPGSESASKLALLAVIGAQS